jgi:hypothetical protein
MRALREIALEIASDSAWTVVKHAGAREALKCMKEMGQIREPFGADPNGYAVVGTFLSGAAHAWRGQIARRIKKELRVMMGHPRP